jgi:6-pyruvoyltetrahydropterin/6-carboxytetrahydropterin synthase
MVVDFKAIKQALAPFLDRFDHSMAINSEDPQAAHLQTAYGDRIVRFDHVDPTSEVMAQHIFAYARDTLRNLALHGPSDARYPLRPAVRVERVRVTETATSWAEYWE